MSHNENVDIRIEVEDDHIVIVLPRKMDDFMTPWQDAWVFGETLEKAAHDIPAKGLIADPVQEARESAQIRLNTHRDKYVVMLFEHTDRIRLCYGAAILVARAIRMKAQDLDYLTRGVRMLYKKGRPVPSWKHPTKRIF